MFEKIHKFKIQKYPEYKIQKYKIQKYEFKDRIVEELFKELVEAEDSLKTPVPVPSAFRGTNTRWLEL